MIIEDVFREIEQRLRRIPKLNVPTPESQAVAPPVAVLEMPERIELKQTYGGAAKFDIEFTVCISKANMRTAVRAAMAYASTEGPQSVSAAVDSTPSDPYDSCDDVCVNSVEFDTVTVAGTDYFGCVFTATIMGG